MRCILSTLWSAIVLLVAGASAAAPVVVGTEIGIDLGPVATTNWNTFSSNSTIGAGSVVDLSGTTVDGVSITTSGGGGYNSDGTDNWVGLAANGGSAPAAFVDSATTDIVFASTASPIVITIAGLDPSLAYDLSAVSTAILVRNDTFTVTSASHETPSTISRPDAVSMGLFHSFPQVVPSAAGVIVVEVTEPLVSNPVANAMLLVAVPLPPAPSLADAAIVPGGSPVLQNGGGTIRLEDGRLGPPAVPLAVPEPGALLQLGSGVGLLALLARRRRDACERSDLSLRKEGTR